MTREERERYGRRRLLEFARQAVPGRRRTPDMFRATKQTITVAAAAPARQADFFTPPKSDPVLAAAALAQLKEFRKHL